MKTIITGTSQGLGKELTNNYKRGDLVVINRTPSGRFDEIMCDLEDKDDVNRASDALMVKLGGEKSARFILNAADYGEDETLNDIDPGMLGNLVYVNIVSQLSIVERLLEKGLTIKLIAISSAMGSVSLAPESYHYAYSISKAGLNLSIRLLRGKYSHLDYMLVDPGWMKTRMGGNSASEDPTEVARHITTASEDPDNWNIPHGLLDVKTRMIITW